MSIANKRIFITPIVSLSLFLSCYKSTSKVYNAHCLIILIATREVSEFMDVSKQLSLDATRFDSLHSAMELNGVTTVDILANSNSQALAKRLGRSIKEIEDFIAYVNGVELAPSEISQSGEINSILTGIKSVDETGFQIPFGEATEIFGQSGSGKSQFLYQISCMAQLSPKNKVVIVNTEKFLETRRLDQIVKGFNDDRISMTNIEYIYCQDLEIMDHILYTQLPVLLKEKSDEIGCVIIDSIGHHLRKEESVTTTTFLKEAIKSQYDDNEILEQDKKRFEQQFNAFFKSNDQYDLRINKRFYFINLYKYLVNLARKYQFALVMSNQITDQVNFNDDDLDLDYQIGWMFGWDKKVILSHQVHQVEDPVNKKSKTNNEENPVNHTNSTSNGKPREEELEEQYKRYINTYSLTKAHIPTLGYHWNKFITNRILMMKTYKPVTTTKSGDKRKLEDFNGWQTERFLKILSPDQSWSDKISYKLDNNGLT